MKIQKSFLCGIIILTAYYAPAQNFTVSGPANGQVVLCGNNKFIIGIDNLPACTLKLKIEITKDYPASNPLAQPYPMPPFPDCIDLSLSGNNPISPELNTNGTTCSITAGFIYNATTKTYDLVVPNLINCDIEYDLKIDCSLIPDNPNAAIFLNETWFINSTPYIPNSPWVQSYPIYFPFIVQSAYTVNIPADYGNTVDVNFSYQNIGFADANISFSLEDQFFLNCGNIIYEPIQGIFMNSRENGGPYTPYQPGQSKTATIHPSDFLEIQYTIKVIDCNTNACMNSPKDIKFKWNCANGLNGFCAECQNEYSTQLTFLPSETPSFTIERIQPSYADAKYYTQCQGTTQPWQFRVTNTSTKTYLKDINITLSNKGNYPNSLTVIDQNTVAISSNCNGCTIGPPSFTPITVSPMPCLTQIPGAIEEIWLNIKDLEPNKYVDLNCSTYYCLTDPTNFSFLYDQAKLFNQWKIAAACTTACNTSFNSTALTPTQDASLDLNSHGAISGYGLDQGLPVDIDQGLYFSTAVASQVAPAYNPTIVNYSTAVHFDINMYDMLGADPDMQQLGYNNSLPPTGILRAKIHCDKGLAISNNGISFTNGLNSWPQMTFNSNATGYFSYIDNNQQTIYSTVMPPQPVCIEADYYFFFKLSDLTGLGLNAKDFLENGKFSFDFLACCDAKQPHSNYSVAFDLLQNEACINFSSWTPEICTSSPCHWLPLSHIEKNVTVLCPGCLAPGIIIHDYLINRITFGKEDVNNTGYTNGNDIVDNGTYSHFADLKRNHAMMGDELEDKTVAYWNPGDNTGAGNPLPGQGYCYDIGNPNDPEMITPPNNYIHLGYLQLQKEFPYSNDNQMKIEVVEFELFIDEPNAMPANGCFDCNNYNTFLTAETILRLQVSGAALSTFISRNNSNPIPPNDDFLFTFSEVDITAWWQNGNPPAGVVINNGLTVSPNQMYQFATSQQYRLRVKYRICGNIYDPSPYATATALKYESIISNIMFATGSPFDLATMKTAPKMPNTLGGNEGMINETPPLIFPQYAAALCPTCTIADQTNFGNKYKFYCQADVGAIDFYSSDALNLTFYYNTSPCSTNIEIYAISQIYRKFIYDLIFPYEFRKPVFLPDTWIIPNPFFNDYSLTSCSLRTFSSNGQSNYVMPITGIINGANITFNHTLSDIDNLLSNTIICNDGVTSGAVFLDQAITLRIQLNFKRTNGCPTDGYLNFSPPSQIDFMNYATNCTTLINNCSPNFSINNVTNYNPNMRWEAPHPNLLFTATPITITATTHQVCWNFSIENKLPLNNYSPHYTDAPNLFIELPSIPNLNNWNVTFNGNIISPANLAGTIFDLSSNLALGTSVSGTICADYQLCSDHLLFDVKMNWNCEPYDGTQPLLCSPTPVAGQLELNDEKVVVSIDQSIPAVFPQQFTLCANHTIKACFKNLYADILARNIVVQGAQSLPITINSVKIINCKTLAFTNLNPIGPETYEITSNDLLSIDINHVYKNENYLKQSECICAEVDFTINCTSLQNLQLPAIKFEYSPYCDITNTAFLNTTQFFPEIPYGGTACTDCFSIEKTSNMASAVINQDIVIYSVKVCNLSATTASVIVADAFPPEFNVISSNINTASFPLPAGGCTTLVATGIFYSSLGAVVGQHIINTAGWISGSNQGNSSVEVEILDDCITINPPQLIIGNSFGSYNLYSQWAGAIALIPLGSPITIYGTFVFNIDEPHLWSKTFALGAGAEIIINSGINVGIKGCTFYGCSKFWKGIQALNSSFLSVILSTIKDAEYGIRAEYNSKISVSAVEFINDYIGIYIPPNASAILYPYPTKVALVVDGCHFYTSGIMKWPYVYQKTTVGDISFAGILAHCTVMNLTPPGTGPNTFTDLSAGVIGYYSDMTIKNCKFERIQPDIKYDPVSIGLFASNFNGSAIYGKDLTATNNYIRQTGFGKPSSSQKSFSACKYMIFADRMNVLSEQNNTEFLTHAYRFAFGTKKDMKIRHNTLDTYSDCIELLYNDASTNTLVWDNEITFGDVNATAITPPAIAINIMESVIPNVNSRIHFNTIIFRNGAGNAHTGINAGSISNFIITENVLNMNNNLFNQNGILLTGSVHNTVSCNSIIGSADFGGLDQSAIVNEMGDGQKIGCNTVNATENGILVLGPVTNTFDFTVEGNNFLDHTFGFHCSLSSLIDNQYVKGNRWFQAPEPGGFHAKHDAGINLNINTYFNTVFDIQQSTFPYFFPLHDPGNWFRPGPGPDFLCSDPIYDPFNPNFILFANYCRQYPYDCPGCSSRSLDDKIADGSLENDPYTDETLWMMQQGLYNKIDNNPDLKTDTLYNNFYNATQNTSIGELKEIDNSKGEMYKLDTTVINLLDSNNTSIWQKLDTVGFKMELLKIALDSGYNTAPIENELQDLETAISDLQASNENTLQLSDTLQKLNAIDIGDDVNALTVTGGIDYNEQVFNAIYLSTIASGIFEFTPEQVEALQNIANECPLIGGNVVFKARALLYLVDHTAFYNDREICNRQGVELRHTKTEETVAKIRLYPNPANESVIVAYESDTECNGTLTLFNTVGQQVRSFILPGNKIQFVFTTGDLAPGIYAFKFTCNNSLIENGKLVVIH